MFENYKGFDVTVEYWEEEVKKKKTAKTVKSKSKKNSGSGIDDDDGDGEKADDDDVDDGDNCEIISEKRKLKTVEGKLVGRDYEKEVTMINIKGRVTKIRNDAIERVCLPKAKREKGVK